MPPKKEKMSKAEKKAMHTEAKDRRKQEMEGGAAAGSSAEDGEEEGEGAEVSVEDFAFSVESLGISPAKVKLQSVLEALRGEATADIPLAVEAAEKTFAASSAFSSEAMTHGCDVWLKWAKKHKLLRVQAAQIPRGILPDDYEATLYDVKVNPKGKIRTDDEIYESDPVVRERVARGNCFFQIKHKGVRRKACVVHSLRKFTGGYGDDDDKADEKLDGDGSGSGDGGEDLAWKKFFLQPLESSPSFVSMQKANGEAAHLGVRWIADRFVLFPGSKNVHIAITKRADIDKYTEQKHSVARNIAHAIMDVIDGLPEGGKDRLLTFLAATELTATFEILQPDYQHVELLPPETHLKFIAWTTTNLVPERSLCFIHPVSGLELARHLGFETVGYQTYPMCDVNKRIAEIRASHGTEGDVLYFLSKEGEVIGLLKKKTAWYVLVRACREKMKGVVQRIAGMLPDVPAYEIDEAKRRLEKTLMKRYTDIADWLQLTKGTITEWHALSWEFAKWVIDGIASGQVVKEEVVAKFPVVWVKFLDETGKSDKIVPKFTDEGAEGL